MATYERRIPAIGLTADLSEDVRAALSERCKWQNHPVNRQIVFRDSTSSDLYFVVRGKVRVVNHAPSGREISFEDIGEGGCFGELAVIDGKPRSASVVALTDTVVASLARPDFLEFVENSPGLAFALLDRLAAEMRQATERIFDLSTLGAHNRVYGEILRLAREINADNNFAAIEPAPRHNVIAGRASTTRETVARVLSDLNRDGLVERKGRKLVVTDLARLEDIVRNFKRV